MRGGPSGTGVLFPSAGEAEADADADAIPEVIVKHISSAEEMDAGAIVARYSRLALGIKRGIDVAVSGVGLLLATPFLAVLAALIRLDSKGPALFFQPRVGRGESPFMIVKLRTMNVDGRVTRVGRFLRPMGLDEVPQLWNVLKGDMSVIGPRPELLHWWPAWKKIPGHGDRHLLRPGITGWAQVNGLRGIVPLDERLHFDLVYTRGWSLALDWRILVRTLATIWSDTRRALRS
jgi:lipopolysaccharide/colanic/teichoic acid biosynthesis glycosyltransferase